MLGQCRQHARRTNTTRVHRQRPSILRRKTCLQNAQSSGNAEQAQAPQVLILIQPWTLHNAQLRRACCGTIACVVEPEPTNSPCPGSLQTNTLFESAAAARRQDDRPRWQRARGSDRAPTLPVQQRARIRPSRPHETTPATSAEELPAHWRSQTKWQAPQKAKKPIGRRHHGSIVLTELLKPRTETRRRRSMGHKKKTNSLLVWKIPRFCDL